MRDTTPCPTCDGERTVFEDRYSHKGGHYTVDVPCPDCTVEVEDEGPEEVESYEERAAEASQESPL